MKFFGYMPNAIRVATKPLLVYSPESIFTIFFSNGNKFLRPLKPNVEFKDYPHKLRYIFLHPHLTPVFRLRNFHFEFYTCPFKFTEVLFTEKQVLNAGFKVV